MPKHNEVPYDCRLCGKTASTRRTLCNTCVSRVRRYRVKKAAVEFLGGVCKRCGWRGDISAFEFHHFGDKDFTIGNNSNKAWKKILLELVKCELLCSNCHRVEHTGERNEKFFAIAEEYGGNSYVW